MNMREYQQVKNLTYLEYCNYLQKKYGVGLDDYMTPAFNPKAKCKRTGEGLFAHHKKEDTMILLSTKEVAETFPFEWQKKDNIVYCDFLEHLFLHILICENPSPDKVEGVDVGYGGVVRFIVPELNDVYSGWKTSQPWRRNCHERVIKDKDVYLELLTRFALFEQKKMGFDITDLLTSFTAAYEAWTIIRNRPLYEEIAKRIVAETEKTKER